MEYDLNKNMEASKIKILKNLIRYKQIFRTRQLSLVIMIQASFQIQEFLLKQELQMILILKKMIRGLKFKKMMRILILKILIPI
jgi:hypothetical protein